MPPLKKNLPRPAADPSTTVFSCFLIPRGEQPPCTYPVVGNSFLDSSISTDFSPTAAAAFFMSSSLLTGTTNT